MASNQQINRFPGLLAVKMIRQISLSKRLTHQSPTRTDMGGSDELEPNTADLRVDHHLWGDCTFMRTSMFLTLNWCLASEYVSLALTWHRTNSSQLAIYRNRVCVDLSKLKNPLKCSRVLCRHPRMNIAGGVLSAMTAVSDSKAPTLLVLLRHGGSASKTQLAASVTQFFCRVDEGLILMGER